MHPDNVREGDIVYFIRKEDGFRWYLDNGVVIHKFHDVADVQKYEFKIQKRINGIPVQDFIAPTRWQKLPNGWTYDTELFSITFDDISYDGKFSLRDKQSITDAIERGYIVPVHDNYHSNFKAEIDHRFGWRIVHDYYQVCEPVDHVGVPYYALYETADEVIEVITEHADELVRQSELTDAEWSAEQIEKTIDRWKGIYGHTDEEAEKYRAFLLSLRNIEDVEVRIMFERLQWKYWKNKTWLEIEL